MLSVVTLLSAAAPLPHTSAQPRPTATATANAATATASAEPRPRVVLRTAAGDVLVALDDARAPQHARAFAAWVAAGVLDGIDIGRVDRGQYVQLFSTRATPLTVAQQRVVARLAPEAAGVTHRRLMLSMDDSTSGPGVPGAVTILLIDNANLDGRYTPFGSVIAGADVLTELSEVRTGADHRPLEALRIASAHPARDGEVLAALRPLTTGRGTGAVLAFASAAALLTGLALGVLRRRARLRRALLQLALLAAYLAVWVGVLEGQGPGGAAAAPTALLLFAAAIGLFRLLSRFEPPPAAAGSRTVTREQSSTD